MGDGNGSYGLNDILSSIKKAKENDKIKGIYIQPSYLATSFASLEEIRNALQDFKESGKFIVAYADQYTQGMYYLDKLCREGNHQSSRKHFMARAGIPTCLL